jgi:hypothetical protein
MKTLETLNTKRVAILIRSSINICVSIADIPSNGYGHWKIERGEFFGESLEID